MNKKRNFEIMPKGAVKKNKKDYCYVFSSLLDNCKVSFYYLYCPEALDTIAGIFYSVLTMKKIEKEQLMLLMELIKQILNIQNLV